MIKKSLKLKLILANLAILALVAGAYFVINQFFSDLPYLEYSPYGALALFFILSLIALRQILHAPLRTILIEMKLLLTGKSFHRIYTKRTDEIGILGHFFNEITANLEKISHDLKEHQ